MPKNLEYRNQFSSSPLNPSYCTAQAHSLRVASETMSSSNILKRVPVWSWRALMTHLGPSETRRFNALPIGTVDYHLDIDYVGAGIREQHLDVVVPHEAAPQLPVYVYFHGGGWTSGDKSATIKYCANQAVGGMIVVNVNYRKATRFHMQHMLQDGAAALAWVREHIEEYGGDPDLVVLGGDSAGGQIASLLGSSIYQPELAERFDLAPTIQRSHLRGIVQHCSAVDLSVMFNPGYFLGLGFLKIQLPKDRWGVSLRHASRFLSPIEWLDAGFPPHFVTTSERDFFYGANMNFVQRLRRWSIPVDTLIYDRSHKRAGHTWQQNYKYPESQEVYRRLRAFVGNVTKAPAVIADAMRPAAMRPSTFGHGALRHASLGHA